MPRHDVSIYSRSSSGGGTKIRVRFTDELKQHWWDEGRTKRNSRIVLQHLIQWFWISLALSYFNDGPSFICHNVLASWSCLKENWSFPCCGFGFMAQICVAEQITEWRLAAGAQEEKNTFSDELSLCHPLPIFFKLCHAIIIQQRRNMQLAAWYNISKLHLSYL